MRRFVIPLAIHLLLSGCVMPPLPQGKPPPEGGPFSGRADLPVEVDIEYLGLDGYAPYQGVTTLGYRLENRGPAREVVLEIHQWPGEDEEGAAHWGYPGLSPRKRLALEAGQEIDGRWILPAAGVLQAAASFPDRVEELLVRDDADGAVVGTARLPKPKQNASPVALIAEGKEAAIALQNELLRTQPDPNQAVQRWETAFLLGDLPTLWHEYRVAAAAILARPWASLEAPEREALGGWVAFGGALVAIPEACPDWDGIPWIDGAAEPGGRPARYGAGVVRIAPEGPLEPGRLSAWLADALPGPGSGSMAIPDAPAPTIGYVMPDIWVLVGFVLGIALLVGPVVHLSLVRLDRREWAWVAVPGASALLSVAMYGLSCGVKGEDRALEVTHAVYSLGDAEESAVATSARLLSSRRVSARIRAEGNQPEPTNVPFLFGSPSPDADPKIELESGFVEFDDISMERWSSADLGFVTTGRAVPLETVVLDGGGIRVRNTGESALSDVFLWTPAGWHAVAPGLDPGRSATVDYLEDGASTTAEIEAGWEVSGGMEEMSRILDSVAYRRWTSLAADAVVVAGCSPEGLPAVSARPEPEIFEERAVCVWHRALWAAEGGAP